MGKFLGKSCMWLVGKFRMWQKWAAVQTTKHPSARIVFSVEEMLIGQVIVFLSLVWFLPVRKLPLKAEIDGVASANVTKDHGARIKSTQRKLLSLNRWCHVHHVDINKYLERISSLNFTQTMCITLYQIAIRAWNYGRIWDIFQPYFIANVWPISLCSDIMSDHVKSMLYKSYQYYVNWNYKHK